MENEIAKLVRLEEQLLLRCIQDEYKLNQRMNPMSEKELHKINSNLKLTSSINLAFKVHENLINRLISLYLKSYYPKEIELLRKIFVIEALYFDYDIYFQASNIPSLIEKLHVIFLNSEFSICNNRLKRSNSKHYLKEFGAVYTLPEISKEIVSRSIKNVTNVTDIESLRCLDFACGTGRFYFEAVSFLQASLSLPLKMIICDILYAVDIDNVALSILKCKVLSLFDKIDGDILSALSNNILQRNALIPNISLIPEFPYSIDLQSDFNSVLKNGGFDVVFSNPPYYLLKVNKNKDSLLQDYFNLLQEKIKKQIDFFKKSGYYDYSIEGMLNYYKLSIEMILKLVKPNGQIGIICPASIFADLSSTRLRKYLLSKNKLLFLRYYPESTNLFDNITQATVIFFLEKSGCSELIKIEIGEDKFQIDFKTIEKIFNANFEIPLIDKVGWRILEKLEKLPKLKDYSYLTNKRGELDLTLHKEHIIYEQNTDFRLIRGNMITQDGIVDKNNEYVQIDSFLVKKSRGFKETDFGKKRLICQQVSNIELRKRLKFTFSEVNDILANSCNYINSNREFDDLIKLNIILNSELLNWRFKVTSSNNHINNYELDKLPIIDIDSFDINTIEQDSNLREIQICRLYGLNEVEAKYILSKTN